MNVMQEDKRRRIGIAALLAVATLAALWGVLDCGFINFDDPSYVVENTHVRSGISLKTIEWSFTTTDEANWHPLTWISHALDYSLFGLDARYHHATSLLLHALAGVALFLSLAKATRARWQSAFVAFVFALHPLHVESVAWIAERKDVLSGLFGILSIGAYLRYARLGGRIWYLSSLVLLALGLMAKPALVTLPFVPVLLDYWPLRRLSVQRSKAGTAEGGPGISFSRSFLEKTPFFVLSLVSSIVTYAVQQSGGAMEMVSSLSMPDRAANAIVSYFRYVRRTILPSDLAVFYPHPGQGLTIVAIAGASIFIALATLFAWRERTPHPYLIAGWLWFLGTLVPMIGLVQVGMQAMADRYTYIPIIGLAIMAAWGVPAAFARLRISRPAPAAAFVLAVASMAWGAHVQASYWKNSRTVFERALAVTSDNFLAHNNLGADLADSGDQAGAVGQLREALRIRPGYIDAHHNLAQSLAALGRKEEALHEYEFVLRRSGGDPQLHASIGSLLADEGRAREAVSQFVEAVRLDPGDVAIRCRLGRLYAGQGQADEARRECEAALRLQPGNSEAHTILGMIAGRQRLNDEAYREFSDAIQNDSTNGEAYNNLGILCDRMGKGDEAFEMYASAARVDPRNWNAQFNLGTALAKRTRYAEAADHWIRSIELNPAAIDARLNLGKLYAVQGKTEEAARQFAEVIRIDSNNVQARYNYGDVLAMQGRFREAELQYVETLRLAPSLEPVREALRRVRNRPPR